MFSRTNTYIHLGAIKYAPTASFNILHMNVCFWTHEIFVSSVENTQ